MDQRSGYNRPQAGYGHGDNANYQQTQGRTNAPQPVQKKEVQISQTAKEKAEAAKEFIEKRYSRLKQEEEERRENWDALNKKMENLELSTTEKELIKRDILHKEAESLRQKRKKMSARDYEPIAIIGRGAFGEVRLCRWKETKEVVAMKKMNKGEMEKKNQIAHVRAERNILASAQNPWIVELKASFQDDRYLYLVMEYLAGGDLMTLLMKKDILSEDEAKFYMAEAILAVESVHKLNYIHRDLKPDNILLDSKGHIKLSDFGLCKHTDIRPRFEFKKMDDTAVQNTFDASNLTKKPQYKRNRKKVFTIVGTPDYIAPEVFGQKGYTETVDWWSLGTILFEMLVGYPPFFSDDSSITCQKIIHWKKTFVIPPEANLSPAAIDLLKRLICDANERLGVNGVEEIKLHPFFAGVDWKRIRDKKAPYVPELKSEVDTSNFDQFEEEEPWYIEDTTKARKVRKNANFIGYTFKRDFEERKYLVSAIEQLESTKASQPRQQKPVQNMMRQQDNLETQASDNSNLGNYSNGSNSTHYMQNLGQTSASNMSSALSSITGGYSSAQPRTQQQQISSQPQLQNPPQSNYGEAYYSSTNYSSAKSPKANVGVNPTNISKQTFFKMPDTKERLEAKARLTGGLANEGTGLKKFTTPVTTSSSKLPSSNMPSSSKGLASGLYKVSKN